MTRMDVVTTSNIEGRAITAYLGVVFAKGPSFDAALQGVVDRANVLGASKVVGLFVEQVSAKSYLAQGTAVTVA
jgi:uncharacterized protein YbjQ (UPF0145 family)